VFLDTRRLADIIGGLDEVDATRIGTTGWSQGGGLSLVCAALTPGVKYTASVYPFLTDYQRAWELNLDRGPYNEITTWFKKRDPRHLREQEVFSTLGYIDLQHLAGRIQGDVSLYVGLEDEVCPPSTQYAVYNKLTGSKEIHLYPDLGHDDLPGAMDEIFQTLSQKL
jgi:cephalosporin-C deacetylase